jgi:ubiquitin C-terminal hydrolase
MPLVVPRGLTGLGNVGNTCYLNACLQALSHTPELDQIINDISSVRYMAGNNLPDGSASPLSSVLCEWRDLRALMWSRDCAIAPNRFVTALQRYALTERNTNFSGFAQNDVSEFLTFLVDIFDRAISRPVKMRINGTPSTETDITAVKCYEMMARMYESGYSNIIRLFNGIQVTQIVGIDGGHRNRVLSASPEPFFVLSLALGRQPPDTAALGRQPPDSPTASGIAPTASGIAPTGIAPTASGIAPTGIAAASGRPSRGGGNNTSFTIYDCLDYYTAGERMDGENCWQNDTTNRREPVIRRTRFWSLPDIFVTSIVRTDVYGRKNRALVSCDPDDLDMTRYMCGYDRSVRYELYAVCNHLGGARGGHYTANIRVGGDWFNFNDTRITPVKGDIVTEAAYMMFWRKKKIE